MAALAEPDAERSQCLVVPIVLRHLRPARVHPRYIFDSGMRVGSFEKGLASKFLVRAAQLRQRSDELRKIAIDLSKAPIDPRYLVVLAVRVIVAQLRAREFVAGLQHRNTLREK